MKYYLQKLQQINFAKFNQIIKRTIFLDIDQFLYKAYNGTFKYPFAVRFNVSFKIKKSDYLEFFDFETKCYGYSFISSRNAFKYTLNRLIKDQLNGVCFPKANDIL